MASSKPPVIALTMGDPCGVGPEIILKALANKRARRNASFLVVGNTSVFRRVARRFGLDADFSTVRAARAAAKSGDVFYLNAARVPARLAAAGGATAEGGTASLDCIRRAAELALGGEADAIVTAPINKYAIALSGASWPGHTEYLGALSGGHRPVMMMVGGGLRAALVTTHCALRDLPRLITRELVLETLRIVAADIKRSFGLAAARVGVCGLNPHAGEEGRFGDEEQKAIAPALDDARREGIHCIGPLPADIAFHQMLRGAYDAVVAMYHDQANIPVKTLAFDRGVNVTLGLPIVRTSPDHGTAYDIAGRGCADASSLLAAIDLAVTITRNRARHE